jgi:hypothetical protein
LGHSGSFGQKRNVNVLVRIPYQKIFYREGFVRAGRSILFLESLNGGNRAGFHWDYANPPGVDTIRVFATTNRQLTSRIRQSVGSAGQAGLNQGVIVGELLAHLVSLRQELIGGMTRGLITVSDEPMVEPPAYENAPSAKRPYSQDAYPQHADGSAFPGGEKNVEYDPGAAYESEAVDPLQAMSVQQPVADWTAASVTVVVQP